MEIVQEEYQDEWINLEKEKPVYFFVKRVIDIVLSLCGLIVLSPVFLLIAILIKKDDGGDVFYKHKRIGHMNQDIYLYKFRSMTSKYKTFDEFYQTLSIEQKEEWDENFKLENDPRITKIGNFLRKTSLDELPQIINILKDSCLSKENINVKEIYNDGQCRIDDKTLETMLIKLNKMIVQRSQKMECIVNSLKKTTCRKENFAVAERKA